MKYHNHPHVLERLLQHTGRWYPMMVLLLMQVINTPLLLLLTSMPAQQNAQFSQSQGISLLLFGSASVLIRNAVLMVQFYRTRREMFTVLTARCRNQVIEDEKILELAWEQASSISRQYIFFEFVELYLLVLLPTILYGFYGLHVSTGQLIHLSLALVAASLVNVIVEILLLDRWLGPVLHMLLPAHFETQLAGLKGMRLSAKFSLAILGLVLVSLSLTIPTAFQQVDLILKDMPHDSGIQTKALLLIINAGFGAVVVGAFLSYQLVSYFSVPFRRMINLFQDVEKGDLSRRIKVTSSDEFGELNIYINHTINRLQHLTSTLEQQVAERTVQLSLTNEKLQEELQERKRMEEMLAHHATHDSLTGLPNRALFLDRLKHAMERCKRHKDLGYAVIFIDLDRFKVVNDSQGHNVGDLLLVESARRLEKCVRSVDMVARLGGDEFVILLEELDSQKDGLMVVDRLQHELSLPADLDGIRVFISISMGIVFSDARYLKPGDVLRDADIAMYHAKRKGRGRHEIFDQDMLDQVMTHMELETELRKALEHEEFIVHYQPILDTQTRKITGFEALVRWQHPTRSLLLPEEFIPTAEETGLIIPLGYWVLEQACRQIHLWQEQYPQEPPLTVNVNLSARQCMHAGLIEKISEILSKHQLDGSSLKLELTESLIIENPEFTTDILNKLRQMGIQVQIDDFGTGYSSLGYLHTLPVDTLKIDRIFISRLCAEGCSEEIVRTILALAHGLGMKVIAEGVETEEQLSSLEAMGCPFVQGFFFAKALESSEAGALLQASIS